MSSYQAGETIRLKATITDSGGVAASPAAVKISINKTDGTAAVEEASMTNLSAGSYYYDYLLPSAIVGTYTYKVTATGSSSRVTIENNLFSVEESI